MSDLNSVEKKYKLVNVYEHNIMNKVRMCMEKEPDICKCEKCFLDICAIVMNKGFARFATTEKGELLSMLSDISESRDVELLVAVLEAIRMVKGSPKHD